jgi:iron complex transport system permease protein
MTAVTAPAARSDRPASAARRLAGLLIAVAALSILLLLSVSVGSKDIPADVVIDALLDRSGQGDAVIWDMRIPRTVIGLAIGITLGVSGALIQALTRNPLADPGILGVDAGAAFFVTLGVGVFGISAVSGYVWFAFAGALVVTVAVYVIGSAGRGVADPIHLTLAGVALGAVLTGFVTALILMDPNTFDRLRNWSAGSLVGRGLDVFLPVLPFLVVGVLLAAFVAPSLNAIALGEDLARSLGTNVALARALVIVAVTLLAGGATAIAGPIGFVGLMVPHVARWFTGPDQRWILAYTVLLAPSLVLAADILGRIVIRPGEFPVGIVTAFVGAPVLILLVRRRKASGL